MKLYVKPSLEVSKFSVEDIITASGVMNDTLSATAQSVYDTYLAKNPADDSDNITGSGKVVEFMW